VILGILIIKNNENINDYPNDKKYHPLKEYLNAFLISKKWNIKQ